MSSQVVSPSHRSFTVETNIDQERSLCRDIVTHTRSVQGIALVPSPRSGPFRLATPLGTMIDIYLSLNGLDLNVCCVLPLKISNASHVSFCISYIYICLLYVQNAYVNLVCTTSLLSFILGMFLMLTSEAYKQITMKHHGGIHVLHYLFQEQAMHAHSHQYFLLHGDHLSMNESEQIMLQPTLQVHMDQQMLACFLILFLPLFPFPQLMLQIFSFVHKHMLFPFI